MGGMIRKLRLKFVAVCMAMVTAVLAVVCFAIFAALRGNVEDLSREVLHRVIQEDPGGRRPEIGVEIGGDKVLLPYFTVSVWPGGGGGNHHPGPGEDGAPGKADGIQPRGAHPGGAAQPAF